MTLEEIKKRIDEIKSVADDDERAHALEDQLHRDVLFAIAGCAQNANDLAMAALRTLYIEFNRWCA